MRKKLILFAIFVFSCLLVVHSQTAGTMTFVVTTSSSSGYSPKHGIIVWLENSSGTFVKTKLKRSANGNLDHFATWTAKSGSNVVDATTGATLTTHGTLTVTWDGTNVSGVVVPDGIYKIWVEYAWASNMTTGKMVTSFSFTKGASADHQTPANYTSGTTGNLTNMTIDWTPTPNAVESVYENSEVSIFPNPMNGIFNVTFKQATNITIENALGAVVYEEKIDPSCNAKNINLSNFAEGIYFINVINGEKSSKHKIILNK